MVETLGKRIVYHRKRLSLTQDQLAEKLGVTAQAVSKWENDLSCPDISVLPMLADIFEISLDTLLGRESYSEPVEAEVVTESPKERANCRSEFDFKWESKKGGIGLACLILSVGALLLLSSIFTWELNFWSALWPTALLIFGLFTLFPRFSFLSLGCTLLGAYFLADNILPVEFHIESGIVWACLILIFGISVFIDAVRGKRHFSYRSSRKHKANGNRSTETLNVEGTCFNFEASFSKVNPLIAMPLLEQGCISVNFGDYCIDLQNIERVADNCTLKAACSFGELQILVPARFTVEPQHASAFAGFSINGTHDPVPKGTIRLTADVSFGKIHVEYV